MCFDREIQTLTFIVITDILSVYFRRNIIVIFLSFILGLIFIIPDFFLFPSTYFSS